MRSARNCSRREVGGRSTRTRSLRERMMPWSGGSRSRRREPRRACGRRSSLHRPMPNEGSSLSVSGCWQFARRTREESLCPESYISGCTKARKRRQRRSHGAIVRIPLRSAMPRHCIVKKAGTPLRGPTLSKSSRRRPRAGRCTTSRRRGAARNGGRIGLRMQRHSPSRRQRRCGRWRDGHASRLLSGSPLRRRVSARRKMILSVRRRLRSSGGLNASFLASSVKPSARLMKRLIARVVLLHKAGGTRLVMSPPRSGSGGGLRRSRSSGSGS